MLLVRFEVLYCNILGDTEEIQGIKFKSTRSEEESNSGFQNSSLCI